MLTCFTDIGRMPYAGTPITGPILDRSTGPILDMSLLASVGAEAKGRRVSEAGKRLVQRALQQRTGMDAFIIV